MGRYPGDTPAELDGAGYVAEDLIRFNGATFVRLPKGSTGQQLVIRSDGTIGYIDPPVVSLKAWGADFTGSQVAGVVTANTTAFNNAKAAAAANQAVLQCESGTCVLNNITAVNGVTIRGAGKRKTTLQLGPASTGNLFTTSLDATGVVLEDIGLDGSLSATTSAGINFIRAAGGPTDCAIRRCMFQNMKKVGGSGGAGIIFAVNGTRIDLDDNVFLNMGNSPILFTEGGVFNDVGMRRNRFDTVMTGVASGSTGQGAIHFIGGYNGLDIIGNRLKNVNTASDAASAIMVQPKGAVTCTQLNILDNTVNGAGNCGIQVFLGTNDVIVEQATVDRNQVYNAGATNQTTGAIFVQPTGGGGSTIDQMRRVRVCDNIVGGGGTNGYGIVVTARFGKVDNNEVTGAHDPGIRVSLGRPTTGDGGTVNGNVVSCPSGGFGIVVTNSHYVAVKGNVADGNGFAGIAIGAFDGGGACDHINVSGNEATRNGVLAAGAFANGMGGIVLNGVTNSKVSTNICTDNVGAGAFACAGIRESGASDNNTLDNNDLRGNQGDVGANPQAHAIATVGAATVAYDNRGVDR